MLAEVLNQVFVIVGDSRRAAEWAVNRMLTSQQLDTLNERLLTRHQSLRSSLCTWVRLGLLLTALFHAADLNTSVATDQQSFLTQHIPVARQTRRHG